MSNVTIIDEMAPALTLYRFGVDNRFRSATWN